MYKIFFPHQLGFYNKKFRKKYFLKKITIFNKQAKQEIIRTQKLGRGATVLTAIMVHTPSVIQALCLRALVI
jgi:hypothetical protein